tara:strand:+ start:2942 stop:3382 length:441 start_codon:yes stop_codon:yes gene_type:complete
MNAENLAIISAGVFFLTGLLTGVWKYQQIMTSEDSIAHPYVDICHRASLLYAFAAILLAKFAEVSQLSNRVELISVGVVVFYFATAITTYLVHGLLKDTDNQLKSPHAMGQLTISSRIISLYMWTLIAAEIGGFLVLFYGVFIAIL